MDELASNLPAGYVLDQYSISAVLGTGSFGITYKAYDNQLQQSVAIKEYLPSDMAGRSSDSISVQPRKDSSGQFRFGLDKFLEEARTLARFRHPNIVRVSRFLETNGTAYLVMDYVEGESLQEYLKRNRKPVSEAQLKAWFVPLLQGLVTVHAAGFLHRDIKPGNIYLRDNGEPVLIDFGAARQAIGEHSKSVTGIFTAGYAPTEQYSTDGKKQGPWTDLYAIGATLYRCIAGQTPVDAPTRQSAVMEGDADPLVPASVRGAGQYSPAFLALIDHLMALPIKDRPQTAAPVLAGLIAGKSLPESEPPDTDATVLADISRSVERVVVSDQRAATVPRQPLPPQSFSGAAVVAPPKKGLPAKALGVIGALVISGLLVTVLVLFQRHSAEVESQKAAQAAEQLRLAEEAKAAAEVQAQDLADAKARAEANERELAEAKIKAAAQASELAAAEAIAEEQKLAAAQAEEQAEEQRLVAAKAQKLAAAKAKPVAQNSAQPQSQAKQDMARMQRQLNAGVMGQPFDAGDPALIDAYIEDAQAKDLKPVTRAPSYWQPGYTCDYIRDYNYDYTTYRDCLYHYQYYGRYW